MQLVTVFLIELIAALLIGHALLWLSRPDGGIKLKPKIGVNGVVSRNAKPDFGRINRDPVNGHKLAENEVAALIANQRVLNEKINLAHERLAQVEESIVSRNLPKAGFDVTGKISSLDSFKSNTEAEICSLREMIDELAKSKGSLSVRKYEGQLKRVDSDLRVLGDDLKVLRSKKSESN